MSWLAIAFLAVIVLGGQASAQTVTATIRGTVVDKTGPIPQASITAVNAQSGFEFKATSATDGSFSLGGLTPGTYELRVSSQAYQEVAQTIEVRVGQTVTVKIELRPKEMFLENVTVVGEKTKVLIDTRSPSVTTNITPEQIQDLPVSNRNFLSFAALAPGISYTQDVEAEGQGFSSGGANPKQVNVYIDGLSYKNDIIKGGAFMQDSSRGNPFPQGAVQEYQVLPQNSNAEYEKTGAAVITAVTKSGGNDFHGDVLYLYQDKNMLALADVPSGLTKPPYKRNQYELSLGGPIMKDTLHFFVLAERYDRDIISTVSHGAQWGQEPANVANILTPYATGSLSAPFREKLYFGKLSWQPNVSQTMDLSYNKRDEEEIRDFGGQRVRSAADDFMIGTDGAVLRHQWVLGGSTLNEASLTYEKMSWQQSALNLSMPDENYIGLLEIGGNDYLQNLIQKRTGLRDDLSLMFDWHGSHTVKAGITVNWMKYDMTKNAYANPYFEFRSDDNWQYPFHAVFGFGNPTLAFSNIEYGAFAQDSWRITPNFTANVGVRWDYETNMLNNNWVTPAGVVDGLNTACRTYSQPVGGQSTWCINQLFNVNDYISTGSNRSSYTGMFQPRLGLTWDVRGDGRTVAFGSWGLYYDRVTLNDIYDEQYRHVWKQYSFCFTEDPAKVGTTIAGCSVPAVLWDPSYLSAAGLAGLIASGQTPGPEVYLLNNNTRPPKSTQ